MAALYADEQFPKAVAEKLRSLKHDVLTVQEAARHRSGCSDGVSLRIDLSAIPSLRSPSLKVLAKKYGQR